MIGGFIINLASSIVWDGAKKGYGAVTSHFFSASAAHDVALEDEFSQLNATDQIKRHAQHLIAAVEQTVGNVNALDPFSCEAAVEQLATTLAGDGSECQALSRRVAEVLSNRGILNSPSEQEVARLAAIVLVAITISKLLPLVQLRTSELAVEGIARLEKRTAAIDASVNEIRMGVMHNSTSDANSEIDAALEKLNAGAPDVAIHLLNELRKRRWDTLTPRERYRLLANMGKARERKGEFAKAAKLYVDAKLHQPLDEVARALEAVAYFLLEDRVKAYSLSEEIIAEYPNCSLAVAVRLRSAPLETAFFDLERSVPVALREELDILHALSARALASSDWESAERLIRTGIELHPQATELQEQLATLIVQVESSAREGNKRINTTRIQEAVAAISEGITRSHAPTDTARLRYTRAEAYDLLGRMEDAETDFRAAIDVEKGEPAIIRRFALFLNRNERDDAAIELLAQTDRGCPDINNRLFLSSLLGTRNRPGDRESASKLLQETILMAKPAAPEMRASLASMLTKLLVGLRKYDDAIKMVDGLDSDFLTGSAKLAIRAEVQWRAGRKDDALFSALEGRRALTTESHVTDRMRVAEALELVGEKREALDIWKSVLEPDQSHTFNYNALECAREVGDDQFILSFCKQLRAAGNADPFATELEVLTQEKYGMFEEAISVMQAYLVAPANENLARVFRVRMSLLGIRRERRELIESDPAKLPSVETALVKVGAAVAHVLRNGSHPEQGVNYAYELVRHHFADPTARQAYVSVMGIGDDLDGSFPSPAVVSPGCAVKYKADDSGEEKWVIIEDGTDPRLEREEIGPNHPWAVDMAGKAVGGQFHLRRDAIQSRTATIQAICSKFVYRKFEILDSWEDRFPEQFFVRKYNAPTKEDGSPDISLILKAIDLQEQQKQEMHSLYRTSPISVTTFAKLSDAGVLESLSHLASEGSLPIRCCWGTTEELKCADKAFANATTLVLDPSAVATLFFSGQFQFLQELTQKCVICESTLDEYLEFQRRFNNPSHGFACKFKGKYLFGEDNPEERRRQEQRLSDFIARIRSLITSRTGENLAVVSPERREELIHLFGRPTAESIAEAAVTGAVLWTDDVAVAEVAMERAGVSKRVWTQLVAKSAAPQDLCDKITLFLLQWGYFFTRVEPELVVVAGTQSGWNPSQPPLSSVLQWVGAPELQDQDAFLVAARMLPLVWRYAIFAHQQEAVTQALAQELLKRPQGRQMVAGIIAGIDDIFGVDVIGAGECKRTLQTALVRIKPSGLIIPTSD